MERTKSTPPPVFHEPIIFSLENHLVNVLSISLLFSLLLSLDIFLSFDLHPLVFDVIGCLYYSVWGVLCLFLLPYLKKMYTLMVQIRDTNPKKLPTTFCERAIFINEMFLYICVLLALLVHFEDWSLELDLSDSHLIVLYIILHLVFGLIAYFLGEILQTIWNMDGTIGGPLLLILLLSNDCSDELDDDHPVFFVLFMGLFIIFHRFLTPKTLAIYLKIKGIISDMLKFVRGENREEKPLADSDSTNNRTYQSSLLFSNSGKTSAREASKGGRMTEGVLSSVDSTTRISSSNSDAKRVRVTFFIDLLSIFLLFSPIFPLSYFLSLDLPHLVIVVLLFSQRLVFLLSFFVSLTVFNKWNTIMVPKLKMIAIYPKNQGTISDLFKFVRGENREETPLVDFYRTKNNRACQSGLQSSNSEKANAREVKQGLVDSTARISSRDFDALDYRAHLGRANKSGPIMLNSEKKDTSEGLNGECLIKSVLSLDDSTKQKSFPDFGATENKAHLVRAYQSGPVVSLSENKNREEALKRECITKSILGLEDLQQHCGGRCDAAAKSFCAICGPGLHTTDSLTRKSFEVLETLMPWEQLRNAIDMDQARQIQTQMCELFDAHGGHPIHVDTYFGWLRTHLCSNLCDSVCIHSIFGEQTIDFVPLLSLRRLTLKGCIRQEKSPYLPWKTLALKCWVRLKKSQDLPRTLQMKSSGRLTAQSTSSLHWPICLTDGGQVVPVPEKKIVTIKTFKRKCRTMSGSFEDHSRHCNSRCKGAANRLGAKRRGSIWYTVKGIHWQHVIHWCPFRQVYSLGGERPAEVISLSMEEELVSRLKFLNVYGVRRLRRLALPSGSESVGHIFSSNEFAATNNKAWGRQDQCGSSASRPEKERTRETPNWEGIASHVITFEHLQQRFGSKREDVAKSLGISVSTLKRVCRHHGIHRWPNRIRNRVLRPPDPHGKKNPSPTFKSLSIIEQITVDNEMGCQNLKPNEFQPDSFEEINFRNTEIGSIAEMLSDWDFLALEEEPSLEGLVSGSVNLTVAACSDPAPCQHPMPTIPDTMTTTHMMPHLAAKGDMRFVTLKVTYRKKIMKFQFPLTSGIIELKEEVKKRLKLDLGSFDIEYKDEDGDCIFLGCDEDLRNHLQRFSNQVIRLLVVDSDANTANFR